MTDDHIWHAQQPPRRREPALTITLVMLTLLVILGGTGLTSLLVYVHQRNVASRIVPASKSQLPSGQSPQMLYTRVTSTSPALIDPLTHSDVLFLTGNSCSPSYSMEGLSLSSNVYRSADNLSKCFFGIASPSNFALQVKMTIVRGDEGGLLFRVDAENSQYFCMFSIDAGGAFNMAITGNPWITLLHRPDAAIKVGYGQPNVLTVIVQGQTVLLYANDHYLGQVTNAIIPASGNIGLAAYNLLDPTTVVFSDLRLWNL